MKPEPDPEMFMRAAIRLSLDSVRRHHGGPFGAVVVRRGKIVGRGWNQVTARNDPTAHAEITALRQAGRKLKTFRLEECEIYSSCEPCPMCLAAIYWAGVTRIYYANSRSDAARINFRDSLIYRELARPPSRRQIPMHQLLRTEALEVFALWRARPDKIEY
jgi:tRNA(Arg) A34 adenosine deaminase TadA